MAAAVAAMSAWVTEVVAAVVGTNQVRPKCTPFPREFRSFEYDFYKKRNHTMHGRRLLAEPHYLDCQRLPVQPNPTYTRVWYILGAGRWGRDWRSSPCLPSKKNPLFFPKHPHLQDLNNLRCCKDAVASSHSLLPCAHRGLNVHVGK